MKINFVLAIALFTLMGCYNYNNPKDFYDAEMKSKCGERKMDYDPLTGQCKG